MMYISEQGVGSYRFFDHSINPTLMLGKDDSPHNHETTFPGYEHVTTVPEPEN